MIEIPEPPSQTACASCGSLLIWMHSARTRTWRAWIQVDEVTVRLHPCRTAQDPVTWRSMPRRPGPVQVEINAAGRAAVEAAIRGETDA